MTRVRCTATGVDGARALVAPAVDNVQCSARGLHETRRRSSFRAVTTPKTKGQLDTKHTEYCNL
jgi:hypothetical protein